MTGLDQLERSLKAADPVGAGDDPEPDLILQAQAIMDRDPPARPVGLRRRRRRLVPLAATAGALAVGIGVAFAVLPGSDKTGLPRPVAAFAQQLDDRRGVLHVRMTDDRALPEPGLPDLDGAWTDEVWLDLGGTGWRHVRTTIRGPEGSAGQKLEQVADARGIDTTATDPRLRPVQQPPDRLKPNYLRDPQLDGVIADPLNLVRSGQLEVVGEDTINGRAAYVVVVKRNEPKIAPDTGEGISDFRFYIAKDDGDLLRVQYRTRAGLTEKDTAMRTFVRDYPVYEVLAPTPENLALTRAHAGR